MTASGAAIAPDPVRARAVIRDQPQTPCDYLRRLRRLAASKSADPLPASERHFRGVLASHDEKPILGIFQDDFESEAAAGQLLLGMHADASAQQRQALEQGGTRPIDEPGCRAL
jgi:hypothetical protein